MGRFIKKIPKGFWWLNARSSMKCLWKVDVWSIYLQGSYITILVVWKASKGLKYAALPLQTLLLQKIVLGLCMELESCSIRVPIFKRNFSFLEKIVELFVKTWQELARLREGDDIFIQITEKSIAWNCQLMFLRISGFSFDNGKSPNKILELATRVS